MNDSDTKRSETKVNYTVIKNYALYTNGILSLYYVDEKYSNDFSL